MAVVFGLLAVLCALAGQWLAAAVLAAGVLGAMSAFRKGTWDREEAVRAGKDYAFPRLFGLVIGLMVFIGAAAFGLLD